VNSGKKAPAPTRNEGDEILHILGKAHHAFSVAYGSALVLCWLGLQTIILLFAVPKLSEFFEGFESELPTPTVWLIHTSNWLNGSGASQSTPGWYFAAPLAVVAAILTILFMYKVQFSFYLVALVLVGSVFAEIAFLLGPLYQQAGNISNF